MAPAIANDTLGIFHPPGVGVPASPHVVAVAERPPGIVFKKNTILQMVMQWSGSLP